MVIDLSARSSFLVLVLSISTASLAQSAERSIDGSGNNSSNPAWGQAGSALGRLGPIHYQDGVGSLIGGSNPREVSNAISSQSGSMPNSLNLSDYVWQWGQFIDHDITLVETGSVSENIPVLGPGDPMGTSIPFNRSNMAAGTGVTTPRQQPNSITSFIDASMMYGSDATRAQALRDPSGGGRLEMTNSGLLNFNDAGLSNANEGPTSDNLMFLSGDIRANENLGLTAMHTVFSREHNRIAADLVSRNAPGLQTDEELYQHTRRILGGIVQSITYNEFLPALLGSHAPTISIGSSYDAMTDPTISTEFATSLYRLGHSMVSSSLITRDLNGTNDGSISMANAFFNPGALTTGSDVDEILGGLAMQAQQELDTQIVDELRNMLFGPPGAGGLDLAALNIQRGRDHGLATYNETRLAFSLAPAVDFSDITSDLQLQATLQALYGNVANVELWVGALAEDHEPGAAVGELLAVSLADQFERLMAGDRFFFLYDEELSGDEIAEIMNTTLADVLLRNTQLTSLQENVFYASPRAVPEPSASLLLLAGMGFLVTRRRR